MLRVIQTPVEFSVCIFALLRNLEQDSQFSFQPRRKVMSKNAQTTTQLHTSHTLVMFKILQARLQQYVNREHPDVQAGFRKGEEPEIRLPTSAGSSKKQKNSRKTSISALLTMPKPLTGWIPINWKILKENTRPPDLPLEKPVCRSGSNS